MMSTLRSCLAGAAFLLGLWANLASAGAEGEAAEAQAEFLKEFLASTEPAEMALFAPIHRLPLNLNGREFSIELFPGQTGSECRITERIFPRMGWLRSVDLSCDGTLDELQQRQTGEPEYRSVEITGRKQELYERDLDLLAWGVAAIGMAIPDAAGVEGFEIPDHSSMARPAEMDAAQTLASDTPLLTRQGLVAEGRYHFFHVSLGDGYKLHRLATAEKVDGRPRTCMDMVFTPELAASGVHRIQFEMPGCGLEGAGFYAVTPGNGFRPLDVTEEERLDWIAGFSRLLHLWHGRYVEK